MDVLSYKGFEIQAVPLQSPDSGKWRINIQIVRHNADGVKSGNFSAGDSYLTREEAVKHCFQFGKQIIDGQSPTCSVADL
ncbi:MAG: hypothetical protein HY205_01050 [Nitrospirae bacterium]|nr:hypothetical protein [Nitrospirota bacterium]